MALTAEEVHYLAEKALAVRRHIIVMTGAAGSGHPGGSLSAADLLVALYFRVMRVDPQRPQWPDRDRLVLAKGHAAPALYAVLAERGYFPVEELLTLRRFGSRLQGHPDMKRLPGVEASTGSLGQGLSIANGMALAAKLDGKDWRVYALLGDGETEEGQVWEAVMTAAHRKLDNLTAIVDYNRLQIDGDVREVKSVQDLARRWEAFGWRVWEIDGHNWQEIIGALEEARYSRGRPAAIIAHTVKGKGVSFMEGKVDWHGTAPKGEEVERALAELEGGCIRER